MPRPLNGRVFLNRILVDVNVDGDVVVDVDEDVMCT